jgi:hypothetical protein
MYLSDINDNENPRVICADEDHNAPSVTDYGDTHIVKRPKANNGKAIDKYLNVENEQGH